MGRPNSATDSEVSGHHESSGASPRHPGPRPGQVPQGPMSGEPQPVQPVRDLIAEPRRECSGYLSSPHAETEYMDCMRNTMDYSNMCDQCLCTMTGRSDWAMCS